jgi:hypothetical protein
MKIKKLLRNILIGLLIFVLLALIALHVGVTVKYWDYFRNSDSEFIIPGLTDAYVPQGFDHIEELDTYLMCGYMSDDTASRIYVRDGNGRTHYVSLYFEDGSAYKKHAGGICWNGDFVYLAGDDGVDVFSLTDVLAGQDCTMLGTIETGHDMACCSFYNGYLFAGNFFYPEHYETPAHHRITTPHGDQNTALMTVYKADADAEFGIDPIPVAVISAREMIQGICITPDGKMVLSTSWGVSRSQLFFYDLSKVQCTEGYNFQGIVTYAGKGEETFEFSNIPLYYLDSSCLVDTVKAPPMSEELVYLDGKIIVFCESACNKCAFGKLTTGYKIYGFEYNK